jgi:phenylalanyl-tRNA synthetase alpha chain
MQSNDGKSGHLHPLTALSERIITIFSDLGFEFATGPEMESEEYNFDMLNVPKDHPSRDMQDTFWIKDRPGMVLRTHTSPVQVRYMEKHKPPLRIITIGRTFRNEKTDATHEAQFSQLEGLAVGPDVSLANLKATLEHFFAKLFGKEITVRFRPSFFPFVEPGVEVDMECFNCDGKGCSVCKHTGWIEMLGAGMVHPNVLDAAQVDSKTNQGFAFGVGVERIAMAVYRIPDLRYFYSGDLRFINQF